MSARKNDGVSITLRLDDYEALSGISALLDRVRSGRSAFFKDVGQHMVNSTRDNFKNETAPDGTKWAPLSKRRIQQRIRLKQNKLGILRAGGQLSGSVRYEFTDDSVTWGATAHNKDKSYARVHQFGGEISIPEHKRTIYRHFNPKTLKTSGKFVKPKNKHKRAEELTYKARKITIPARPYLGVGARDMAGIIEAAERWLSFDSIP